MNSLWTNSHNLNILILLLSLSLFKINAAKYLRLSSAMSKKIV